MTIFEAIQPHLIDKVTVHLIAKRTNILCSIGFAKKVSDHWLIATTEINKNEYFFINREVIYHVFTTK